jgi:hypothetical protein
VRQGTRSADVHATFRIAARLVNADVAAATMTYWASQLTMAAAPAKTARAAIAPTSQARPVRGRGRSRVAVLGPAWPDRCALARPL